MGPLEVINFRTLGPATPLRPLRILECDLLSVVFVSTLQSPVTHIISFDPPSRPLKQTRKGFSASLTGEKTGLEQLQVTGRAGPDQVLQLQSPCSLQFIVGPLHDTCIAIKKSVDPSFSP